MRKCGILFCFVFAKGELKGERCHQKLRYGTSSFFARAAVSLFTRILYICNGIFKKALYFVSIIFKKRDSLLIRENQANPQSTMLLIFESYKFNRVYNFDCRLSVNKQIIDFSSYNLKKIIVKFTRIFVPGIALPSFENRTKLSYFADFYRTWEFLFCSKSFHKK